MSVHYDGSQNATDDKMVRLPVYRRWVFLTYIWNGLLFLPLFILIFVIGQLGSNWTVDSIKGLALWSLVIIENYAIRPKAMYAYGDTVLLGGAWRRHRQRLLLRPDARLEVVRSRFPRLRCSTIILKSREDSLELVTLLTLTRSQRGCTGELSLRISDELGIGPMSSS